MRKSTLLIALLFSITILLTGCTEVLVEEEVQVEEDQYASWEIVLNKAREVNIDYNVKSGEPLEVLFLNAKNYNLFVQKLNEQTEESIKYVSDLSTFGSKESSRTAKVSAGTYYLVLENTDLGKLYPPMNFKNDIVTLDIKVIKK